MIFVAVGTQFSFDRLVQYMDDWASSNEESVVIQIGDGDYVPKHAESHRFMDGEQYNHLIKEATVFVSHAGMGNIISARGNQTPIVVINRQYKLGEHRNDHQAEGLQWMGQLPGVYTASTQEELYAQLEQRNSLSSPGETENENRQKLINFIGDYVEGKVS